MFEWIGSITKHEKKLEAWAKVLRFVPRPLLFLLLQFLGLLLYMAAGGIRRRIRSNMADLLGSMSYRHSHRLCRRYSANAVITVYEILIGCFDLKRDGLKRLRLEGEEVIEEALKDGKGVILFTPHTGNFFYYYWALCQRYHCLTVGTAGDPALYPLYERFLKLGCNGLDYDRVPPLELVRSLKRHLNEGGVVMLLGDFFRPNFPEAQMFGRQTRSPYGAASLALDHDIPVIPYYGRRERLFRHRIQVGEPIRLSREFGKQQRQEATNRLNQFLEETIRREPDQWFYWFNAEERWEKG